MSKADAQRAAYISASAELAQRAPIGDHDILFFFGDLNYRINENDRTLDDIYRIMHEDLELLKVDDQLNIERREGRAFQGFSEGSLTFLPTYKFIAGTGEYDRRPDKKMRVPAWCDRILWRVGKAVHAAAAAGAERGDGAPADESTDTGSELGLSASVSKDSLSSCRPVVERVEQLRYQRCDNIISDHRPIRSSFNITVKRYLGYNLHLSQFKAYVTIVN